MGDGTRRLPAALLFRHFHCALKRSSANQRSPCLEFPSLCSRCRGKWVTRRVTDPRAEMQNSSYPQVNNIRLRRGSRASMLRHLRASVLADPASVVIPGPTPQKRSPMTRGLRCWLA